MQRSTAVWVVPFGFTVSVVDAWFSIQSIAGVIKADDPLGLTVACVVGLSLTGFAVFLPVLRDAFHSLPWGLLWFVLTVVDLGTSVAGAIWYGVMDKPFTEPINLGKIAYNPDKLASTLIWLAFVILIAVACVVLGHAILALSRKPKDSDRKDDDNDLDDDEKINIAQ
jgi:hypothetical protein